MKEPEVNLLLETYILTDEYFDTNQLNYNASYYEDVGGGGGIAGD